MYLNDRIYQATLSTDVYRQYLFEKSKNLDHDLSDRKITSYWIDGYEFDQIQRLKNTKTLLLTNNRVLVDDAELHKHIHTVHHDFYGVFYCDYQVDAHRPIQRCYNFFVNRYDPFRQSWFYQLIRHNYLDQGFVSFHSESRVNVGSQSEADTAKKTFEQGFHNHNKIFEQEHLLIKDQIPYQNFVDHGDLTELILASKYSLVIETWFHDNRIITVSEKIMRCLQLPRPWILFSTARTVEHLRSWGFDVLDDVIDHGYDNIQDPIERQSHMLRQMQDLNNMEFSSSVIDRCQAASQHNRALLKSWNQTWVINMDRNFQQAREKVKQL